MPTTDYTVKDGTRVPGVTTVLGNLGWNKRALMLWAFKCGKEGKNIDSVRDEAASAGSIAHYFCECFLRNQPVDRSTFKDASDREWELGEGAFNSFMEWYNDDHWETILIEPHLISETHRFGGTPDWVARRASNQKVYLFDFKTSRAVYDDHKIQLSAYVNLLKENNHDITGGACVIQLGRFSDELAYHWFSLEKLEPYWQVFQHLLGIHKLRSLMSQAPHTKKASQKKKVEENGMVSTAQVSLFPGKDA